MAARWETASGSAPKVLCCFDAMKSCRDAAWWMSSSAALSINARSYTLYMDGGGRVPAPCQHREEPLLYPVQMRHYLEG